MASRLIRRVRMLCGFARYSRRFVSASVLRSMASWAVMTGVSSCLIETPDMRVTEAAYI
jgi:hypothetical protein